MVVREDIDVLLHVRIPVVYPKGILWSGIGC